jgi:hypothetical protein
VTSSAEPAGANCEKGGSKFVAGASTTYACNGKDGTTGFTKTLPVGETLKGLYSWSGTSAAPGTFIPISFNIPLAAGLDENHVIFVTLATNPDPTKCTGTVGEPKAVSGYLCVYQASTTIPPPILGIVKSNFESEGFGASPAGAFVAYAASATTAAARGSWAVTG